MADAKTISYDHLALNIIDYAQLHDHLLIPDYGQFDCFIVNSDPLIDSNTFGNIAHLMAAAPTDWVESLGYSAEAIHDAVDRAAVEVQRQHEIGDGSPMTSWDESLVTIEDIARYVRLGGLGFQSVKVVIVVGRDEKAFLDLIEALGSGK